MSSIAKALILLGVFLILLGVGIFVLGKLGFGRLPGDIYLRRGNFSLYFPITTCILLSLPLTLILSFFLRK